MLRGSYGHDLAPGHCRGTEDNGNFRSRPQRERKMTVAVWRAARRATAERQRARFALWELMEDISLRTGLTEADYQAPSVADWLGSSMMFNLVPGREGGFLNSVVKLLFSPLTASNIKRMHDRLRGAEELTKFLGDSDVPVEYAAEITRQHKMQYIRYYDLDFNEQCFHFLISEKEFFSSCQQKLFREKAAHEYTRIFNDANNPMHKVWKRRIISFPKAMEKRMRLRKENKPTFFIPRVSWNGSRLYYPECNVAPDVSSDDSDKDEDLDEILENQQTVNDHPFPTDTYATHESIDPNRTIVVEQQQHAYNLPVIESQGDMRQTEGQPFEYQRHSRPPARQSATSGDGPPTTSGQRSLSECPGSGFFSQAGTSRTFHSNFQRENIRHHSSSVVQETNVSRPVPPPPTNMEVQSFEDQRRSRSPARQSPASGDGPPTTSAQRSRSEHPCGRGADAFPISTTATDSSQIQRENTRHRSTAVVGEANNSRPPPVSSEVTEPQPQEEPQRPNPIPQQAVPFQSATAMMWSGAVNVKVRPAAPVTVASRQPVISVQPRPAPPRPTPAPQPVAPAPVPGWVIPEAQRIRPPVLRYDDPSFNQSAVAQPRPEPRQIPPVVPWSQSNPVAAPSIPPARELAPPTPPMAIPWGPAVSHGTLTPTPTTIGRPSRFAVDPVAHFPQMPPSAVASNRAPAVASRGLDETPVASRTTSTRAVAPPVANTVAPVRQIIVRIERGGWPTLPLNRYAVASGRPAAVAQQPSVFDRASRHHNASAAVASRRPGNAPVVSRPSAVAPPVAAPVVRPGRVFGLQRELPTGRRAVASTSQTAVSAQRSQSAASRDSQKSVFDLAFAGNTATQRNGRPQAPARSFGIQRPSTQIAEPVDVVADDSAVRPGEDSIFGVPMQRILEVVVNFLAKAHPVIVSDLELQAEIGRELWADDIVPVEHFFAECIGYLRCTDLFRIVGDVVGAMTVEIADLGDCSIKTSEIHVPALADAQMRVWMAEEIARFLLTIPSRKCTRQHLETECTQEFFDNLPRRYPHVFILKCPGVIALAPEAARRH